MKKYTFDMEKIAQAQQQDKKIKFNKKGTLTNRPAAISAVISAIITVAFMVPAARELIEDKVSFFNWFSLSPRVIPVGGCLSSGLCWDGVAKTIPIMQNLGLFLMIYSITMVVALGIQMIILRINNKDKKGN